MNWTDVAKLAVPLLALIYGSGDYFRWWDQLRGREGALAAWRRLASPQGSPVTFIYEDEKEYAPLARLIEQKTGNIRVKQLAGKGIRASLITVAGGARLPADVPDDWPEAVRVGKGAKAVFVPDTTPILCCYGVTKSHGKGKLTWAGTLGDLRRWIDEQRARERFYVSTGLIGLLSLTVAATT